MKKYLPYILLAVLGVLSFSIPAFGAYSIQSNTGGGLGVSVQAPLTSQIVPPVAALAQATSTGSVFSNNGTPIYFQVTALDNVGESLGSGVLSTSTVSQAWGIQITWPAVVGAWGYKIYFSTSTPTALTQYFVATSTGIVPNAYYDFTSTSSPIYVPGGPPSSNSAYVNYASAATSSNSYLNAGNVGIGTTTPLTILSVVKEPLGQGAFATTTLTFGDYATTTSRTCINVNNAAGVAVSFYVSAANTIVVEASKCK